jgi:hypothetical protein
LVESARIHGEGGEIIGEDEMTEERSRASTAVMSEEEVKSKRSQ